jgi:hypothetical protein
MLYVSVVFLALAGACGGVVGATVVGHNSYQTFSAERTGPGPLKLMAGATWASLEHWLFWVAVTLMVFALGLFVPRRHRTKA